MAKILIIDDDEELCAELGQVLETQGFEVNMSFEGQKGLQCLAQDQYHLIILDLRLPGLNGYEVLRRIKKTHEHLKVVVLSGRPLGGQPLMKEDGVSKDGEEKILGLADSIVNKPFMIEDLLEKIKSLL